MLETVNRKVKRYIKNRGKKRKIKKEKKVRADFLKDFSKARGAESCAPCACLAGRQAAARTERREALFIFRQELPEKRTKENAKILPVRLWRKELLYNLNGATGGLNKKLLSVVRLRH
ncbi:MAG: hypothetical protein UY06_C0005G0010 [Candidatus Amesbacteria bacterium GW2011_GWA2_47_70]|nr:MAG: hypothetical protein UY06_C0005G0010 [Candidatus Amesbacteria bacterium GW2011_GWA2_47_70]